MNLFLIAALLSSALSAATASDWRQFRGPQGSAAAPAANLPAKLDPQMNILWNAPLPGRGHSTPIVVGGRVFLTATTESDRLHVLCFDASSGQRLWERQFWATGRTICHEKISLAAPSPVSDGERIFALFSSNDLFCLDLDGNLLWVRGLMRDYPNASNGLGLSASPVVADGTLVAQVETASDAFAIGLDAATGVNRWKIERPRAVNWTSPAVYKDESGKHLVALQSVKGIQAVEAATGREVWNYAEGGSPIPSSVLASGVLYVPASGIAAVRVPASGGAPAELWRSAQLRAGTASPVVLGDRLYILNDGGILTCAAAGSGARLWQLRLKGPFTSSPLAAGALIYTVSEKGLLQVVDPSKPEGEVTGELDLGETILCTPSIAGDALFLRSDGRLWKIGQPRAAVL